MINELKKGNSLISNCHTCELHLLKKAPLRFFVVLNKCSVTYEGGLYRHHAPHHVIVAYNGSKSDLSQKINQKEKKTKVPYRWNCFFFI